MGAAISSSAFWEHAYLYAHPQKKLTTSYETESNGIKFVKEIEFSIDDALKLIEKKGMFMDITLVLDIDLTLGEALMSSLDQKSNYKLKINQNLVEPHHLDRLHKLQKIEWFHDGTCCFFIRPYFQQFIRFCINNFKEVVIWTNGVKQHADDMSNLVYKITGYKLRAFDRNYSTGLNTIKFVSNLGLDQTKTWMVDDDHRHYRNPEDRDEVKSVNPYIKFFHSPEFSVSAFESFFDDKLIHWYHNEKMLDLYDDWFLFLIWNWNYMKENNIQMKYFHRENKKFIHE
jgi:hypothetical protein